MHIYLASSWRNQHYPSCLKGLRDAGHEVYDFRNDGKAFHWSQLDPQWERWNLTEYRTALSNPMAVDAREADEAALEECDCVVMLLPCGSSAHLELGWAIAAGKFTVVVLDGSTRPQLMYGMADVIVHSGSGLVDALHCPLCRAPYGGILEAHDMICENCQED